MNVETISLETAYRRWGRDLVAFASTMTSGSDAVDVVADVFERLLADPDRWASIERPRPYLFRCVSNEVAAHARTRSRRRGRELAAHGTEPRRAPDDEVGGSANSVLVDVRIERALDSLSPQQRAVIYLTYWHDESIDAVAATLGVRPGTVRRHLARARSHLRGALS